MEEQLNNSEVYVIDNVSTLQWKFYDDTERYNEFYPVLKESYTNEIELIKRINELNSVYNISREPSLQSDPDTDKCAIPVPPTYNIDTFNQLLNYDWFIPIVNDTQVVYNETYANGNFISVRESVNYGDIDTLIHATLPYTVQEDSTMYSTFKIPMNKTVMRKDGTFRMAYSEEVNLIGICIMISTLKYVILFDNDTIKRVAERTKRNTATVKEQIMVIGLSVALQYARSTTSVNNNATDVYIDSETDVQREQSESVTMELNGKCGVTHNIELYNEYPYYGMANDTHEQRLLWLKGQKDNGQLFNLLDYLESSISSKQFIGETVDIDIDKLIELYCNKGCINKSDRCEIKNNVCTVTTKQEQYLNTVKELFKSVAYTMKLMKGVMEAEDRIMYIVKEREKRKDIINSIVRQNSLAIKGMSVEEIHNYATKQITKMLEYRERFNKYPCKHYTLYNKFIKSETIDEYTPLLNSLLSMYAGETVFNTVQCKVCGFDLICEHYNVLNELTQNPSNLSVIKKYNSYIVENHDTSESMCKHCGVVVNKGVIVTDVAFDKESGQLKSGVVLETREQIRLNEQIQETLSLAGITGLNSKSITKEISGVFVTAIKRVNKTYKNDPEAKQNHAILLYNGTVYGYIIHIIIKSNYTINFGVSFGIKDSDPVHALIKTVMKLIKTVNFSQYTVMEKLHLEKFILYYYTLFKNQIVVSVVKTTELSVSPSSASNDIGALFCYDTVKEISKDTLKGSTTEYIEQIVKVYSKRREQYVKTGDTRINETERQLIVNVLKATDSETVTTDEINKVLMESVKLINDRNALNRMLSKLNRTVLVNVYSYLNERAKLFMMKMSLSVRDSSLLLMTTDTPYYIDSIGTVLRSSIITKLITRIVNKYTVLSLPKERIDKVNHHNYNRDNQRVMKYTTKEYSPNGVKYDFSIKVYIKNGKVYKEEPIVEPNMSIISSANNAGYRRVYNYYNYEQNETDGVTIDKRCVNTGTLYSEYQKQPIVAVSEELVNSVRETNKAVEYFIYYCLDGVPHELQIEYTDSLQLFCKRCGQHFNESDESDVYNYYKRVSKRTSKLNLTQLETIEPVTITVSKLSNINTTYDISTERVDTNTVTEHLYKLAGSSTRNVSSSLSYGGKVNRTSKYNKSMKSINTVDTRYPINSLQFAIKFMDYGMLTKRMAEEITLVRNISGEQVDTDTFVQGSISDYELMVRYNTTDRKQLQTVVRNRYKQNRIDQLIYTISKLQEHYNTLRNSDAYSVFKGTDTEYLTDYRGVTDKVIPNTSTIVSIVVSASDISLDQKCNALMNLLISVIGHIIDNPKMALFVIHFMKRQFDRVDLLDTTIAETQNSLELQEFKIKEKQSYILTMSMEQKKLLGMGYMSFEQQEHEKIRWADQQELLEKSEDLLNVIDIIEGNNDANVDDNLEVNENVQYEINPEVDYDVDADHDEA